MNRALKDAVDSQLRPLGWTGSLPHLRRRSQDQICLLSVQFLSTSGSFAAEIAECGPEGYTSFRHWPPNKVTAQCINEDRPRIGGPAFPAGDHWFTFGPRAYEPGADVVQPQERYDRVAAEVLRAIEQQAEPWWRDQLAARRANR